MPFQSAFAQLFKQDIAIAWVVFGLVTLERWLNGAAVVAFWGGINTLLAAMLAGFTAAGLDGSAGHGGALQFVLSCGKWIAILAVVPFGIAVLLEVSARRS